MLYSISLGANELSVICCMRTLLYLLKLVKNKYPNVLLHKHVDTSMIWHKNLNIRNTFMLFILWFYSPFPGMASPNWSSKTMVLNGVGLSTPFLLPNIGPAFYTGFTPIEGMAHVWRAPLPFIVGQTLSDPYAEVCQAWVSLLVVAVLLA